MDTSPVRLEQIQSEDLEAAIQELREGTSKPPYRDARHWVVRLPTGETFPAKAVVGVAYRIATGAYPKAFWGGPQTNNFLRKRGYTVESIIDDEREDPDTTIPTYLFTWNPERFRWDEFGVDYRAIRSGTPGDGKWSSGNNRSIQPGSRFFILRQSVEPKGIIGSGFVTSAVFEEESWESPDVRIHYNEIKFDVLLDPSREPILSTSELLKIYDRPGFWGVPSSGVRVPDEVAELVEQKWAELLLQRRITPARIDSETGTLSDGLPTGDERVKALARVTLRPAQTAFRESLRDRYGDGCQISGCPVMGVVQACHLVRVTDNGNDATNNGILLRVDLHILFDADLIGIDPESLRVQLHSSLAATEYAELDGVELRTGADRPSKAALVHRWESFQRRIAR